MILSNRDVGSTLVIALCSVQMLQYSLDAPASWHRELTSLLLTPPVSVDVDLVSKPYG